MARVTRLCLFLAFKILVVNIKGSAAYLSDVPNEVEDTTIYDGNTLSLAATTSPKTLSTDVELSHLTPTKKGKQMPDTSPIETQLTESVTQTNTEPLGVTNVTEASVKLASTNVENKYASTSGTSSTTKHTTHHMRTHHMRTHHTKTHHMKTHRSKILHTNTGRAQSVITLETEKSQTEAPYHRSSDRNIEAERTNKVLTIHTSASTDKRKHQGTQSTTSVKSVLTDAVTTETNSITDGLTMSSDIPTNNGTTSGVQLSSWKDVSISKGTSERSATIEATTGNIMLLYEGTSGLTRPIFETTSNKNPLITKETGGLPSGALSEDSSTDGATMGHVFLTDTTSTDGGIQPANDNTTIVNASRTITNFLVQEDIVTDNGVSVNKTANTPSYAVTNLPTLTTEAPMTTMMQTTVMQTTASLILGTPCINENPNITVSSVHFCLCEPVKGATHYTALAETVPQPAFLVKAGQMETDMDDDFDMSKDSAEEDEVKWEYVEERYDTAVVSDGGALCAHFTDLTGGRQYRFTVQAMRSPALPPESTSLPLYWATTAVPPSFMEPIVHHSWVLLRWFFARPIYAQYYNVTHRWLDQISVSVTNLPGSQLEWKESMLMSGGTYTFRVIVQTPWESAYSEITRTTELYQPRVYVKHSTPVSVNLAWNYDDDTFVEQYTIKYSAIGSNETKVVLFSGSWMEDNSFNVTGLISGGVYNFYLIAESGSSSKTTQLSVATELIKPSVNFTFTNHTSLGLQWGFNNQQVIFEYYNFSYSLLPPINGSNGDTFHFETIFPLWQNNLEINNLIPGARYAFKLQAVGDRSSSMTRMNKSTRPEKPTGLKILSFDASSIELGWNQTYIDHVQYFRIKYHSTTTHVTREVKSLGPIRRITHLSPGDNYKIYVSTVGLGEESPYAMVEQRTKLQGPMVITIYNHTDSSVSIRWSIPWVNVVSEWSFWCEGPGCNLETADTYTYIKTSATEGQHTFDGLHSGESYHFVVNVWSDLENLGGSVFQTTAPARPVNLRVVDYTSTSICLTWEAPINSSVQEYFITYQGLMEPMIGNSTFTFLQRSLDAELKNLLPGDFYRIKVQSVQNGALSVPVENIQSTRLAQVTVVKSHTITNNSFILEWVSARGYYDNVRVQCSNCSYTEVARSVPKTSNRITFTNLKSGAMYVIKLITMRNGFQDGYPVAFKASTYPDSPEIIEVKSSSDRHITLTWSGVPCDGCHVDYYFIDKSSDDGDSLHNDGTSCASSANGSEKLCTKTFLNLHPGHLYTFKVTAVSFGLRSQRPTYLRERTKPAIPGEISLSLIDTRTLTVQWLPSVGIVDSYIINIRSGQHSVDESREVGYNLRQQQFRRLSPGKPYTISIIASMAGLLSAERSIVVHTKPDIPGRVDNFQVKALSPVEVLATFSEPRIPNGIIEAYYISYYGITNKGKPCPSVLDKRLPGTIIKATIGNLYAGCNYTFSITASTGAGKGQPVIQYVRTPIGAPKATGRQPGVPPSDAIHKHSFEVTFDTTFFDEAYGEIHSYTVLVAEATTINTHVPESKNITNSPVLMTWAQTLDYDVIPRYQIREPYPYAELFEDETHYARRKREAVFSRDIVIGQDKCSKTKKTEYCNGPLKSGGTYVYQYRGFSANGYSDTVFSPPIQLPSDQTALIVGISVVLIVLFLISLILAVLVIGRRWKYIPYRGKYMLANTSEPLTSGTMASRGSRASKIKFTRPVLLTEFCQDYHTLNAHSHYGFSQEYEAIRKVGKKMNCNAAILPDNVSKNRYTNILPYDKTRVKLSSIDDDEGSDYINSNYIPGFNSPREFIACQGPLPGTTDDMWKMIWEHNVSTIVMVTQLVEKGKVKCDQYWPEDHKTVYYGEIQVIMTSMSERQDWTIREFTLQKADNAKKVSHFNYLSWPDHGVPESSDTLLGFIKSVRQQTPRNGTPTVVHCSAGVGRTGTYIALDRILHEIEDSDYIDIMGIVSEMRLHRNYMVQTEQQYVFIHRCVLDMLAEKGIAPRQMPISLNGDAADHSCKV